jgi:hypothetical protein
MYRIIKLGKCLAVTVFAFILPAIVSAQAADTASAQSSNVQPRITQAVDESNLTLLSGNTYPLARAEFDRGPADSGMALHRMLLVLKRSPEQEIALQQLLLSLQDKNSPNYHKWLTPEQFGQQFGPAGQDLQIVTSWLASHGFQVAGVSKGRVVVEFSGTVGQVLEAFHAAIHKYVVNGEAHWANSGDPQIPTALAPVVGGVSTLHNFVKKPHVRISGSIAKGTIKSGKHPDITFTNGSHAVAPADFATIYNLNPLYTAGVTGTESGIAVVARSNIDVNDVADFRSLFGLPGNFGLNSITLNGPDPGNLGGGEEVEAVLDATWSGAVAPTANIIVVVSETTETTDGVDLSETFIIDNDLAPIMTESFGLCEQDTVAGQEATELNLAEQAAAQGVTFIASTGDAGAEGCDDPNSETVATGPIAVQIPAALPFTTAVGGTMFNENGKDGAFWNSTNGSGFGSAIKYIPEDVWNESCVSGGCSANLQPNISAGSGGASSSVLFGKPAFQGGVNGIPADGHRDVPDVALNAAAGHDPVVICVLDIQEQLGGGSCVPNAQGQFSVLPVGGTSVAAPSFAGIMALVIQKVGIGSRQGEAGFVIYKLAAAETLASCNGSSQTTAPASTCIFNDVTVGNNAVPGETGFGTSSAKFQAGVGYDQATGLGSMNVNNLVNQWSTARTSQSMTAISFSTGFPITHGSSANFSVSVTPQPPSTGTPTGDVSLLALMGIDGIPVAVQSSTLGSNGTASGATTLLPGGSYNLSAHYEGDGTFLPSDSIGIPVTVNPEASKTQVQIETFDLNSGQQINPNATTVAYGSLYLWRTNVSSASGDTCAQNTLGESGCPTGTVGLTDHGQPTVFGSLALNSLGYAENQNLQLSGGSHALGAIYSGDNSFNPSSSPTDPVTVTPLATTTTVTASASNIGPEQSVTLTATINVSAQSIGNPPSGVVNFLSGGTGASAPVVGTSNSTTHTVQATASVLTQLPLGMDSITAQYVSDGNYSSSTSTPITINVANTPDFSFSSGTTVTIASPGGSGMATLTVAPVNGFTGTVSFSCTGLPFESSCSAPPVTGGGTSTLTITTMGHSSVPSKQSPRAFKWPNFRDQLGIVVLCLVNLLILAMKRRRWTGILAPLAVICLVAISACGGSGSGGGNPGTPIGNSNVIVTATSTVGGTTLSHKVSLTLVVN